MTQVGIGIRSRTGNSEALAETTSLLNPVKWTEPVDSALTSFVDPFIHFEARPLVRYLTRSEQRIMKKALLSSTRLISQG
jgi:hypothetical protein